MPTPKGSQALPQPTAGDSWWRPEGGSTEQGARTWQPWGYIVHSPGVTKIWLEEVDVGLTHHAPLAIVLVIYHLDHDGQCIGFLCGHELHERQECEPHFPAPGEGCPCPCSSSSRWRGVSYHQEEEDGLREIGVGLEVLDGFRLD